MWRACDGAGGGGHNSGDGAAQQHYVDGAGVGCGGADLRVRVIVRVVVGAAGVADSQRDLPAGDAVGGAGHHGVHQHAIHVPDSAVVPSHAVLFQVGHLPVLRRVGGGHVRFHALLHPGDQGRPHRRNGPGVDQALVLEALCTPPADSGARRYAHGRAEGQQSGERPQALTL